MHVSACIFAGGVGRRMGAEKPKQFLEVDSKPIIVHTLEHFELNKKIDDIVISCKKEWIDYTWNLVKRYNISKVKWIVPGGPTGQLSIFAGLDELRKQLDTVENTIVLVHDGVRPLINQETINKCIEKVIESGTAITIAPAIETVITLNDDNTLNSVVERGHCRMAKAPQCFMLDDILSAHDDAMRKGKYDYIDSAALMSAYGFKLFCVEGPNENIKITTPIDFFTFETIYKMRCVVE